MEKMIEEAKIASRMIRTDRWIFHRKEVEGIEEELIRRRLLQEKEKLEQQQ